MPTYEYRCETCGELFEHRESIAEHEAGKPRCPKCDGDNVARVFSLVYVKTAKKS